MTQHKTLAASLVTAGVLGAGLGGGLLIRSTGTPTATQPAAATDTGTDQSSTGTAGSRDQAATGVSAGTGQPAAHSAGS